MSGIAGVWSKDPHNLAPLQSVQTMINSVAHRGPDGQHTRLNKEIAFAHAHLHSSPQSKFEKLPWVDSISGCTVTADTRLDNREELLQRLFQTTNNPLQIGDGQLIVAAYLKWGKACPKFLKGDFSFALWDPRSYSLFAARDNFGIKPFAYFYDKDIFAFASLPKGVIACPGLPRNINNPRIADILVPRLEGINHHITFFENIFRLPPAHSLSLTPEGISIARYWQLEVPPKLHLNSDKAYQDAFQEVFTHAVSRRLAGEDQVGAMLSGGMDSSAIVAVGRKINQSSGKRPLKTFSGALPAKQAAESYECHCIDAVINQGGIEAFKVFPASCSSSAPSYEAFSTMSDNPFEASMELLRAVSQKASSKGIKSLLSGADGDLTTSLSPRVILYMMQNGDISEAVKEQYLYGLLFNCPRYAAWTFIDCLPPAFLPKKVWHHLRYRKKNYALKKNIKASIIHPDFANSINLRARLSEIYDIELPEIEFSTIEQRQAHLLTSPSLTAGLERYDSITGQYGMECAHPYLDVDLIHFCLSLPWRQKIRCGWNKWILRQTIGSDLPPDIQWRTDLSHLSPYFTKAARTAKIQNLSSAEEHNIKRALAPYIQPTALPSELSDYMLSLGSWIHHHS